ncbi:lysophospholipase L1-like esterase [Deinococcus yavapaiensis KR-236]|uniref:Lysophospholipase L1-like esterase n=2 Tax=Deinococcus TaxID=1298 RepID=A0A318SHB5_9DEIO|nr:lysophospholipase L1-like esterase [Deinococcus yavapaiensis KR-236]
MLQKAWGTNSVLVLNKGVGGNTLFDLMARRQRDVYALKPDLVIVQTSLNDARANVDVEKFHAQFSLLVRELRARKIDVLIMDGQYVPEATRPQRYGLYLQATWEVVVNQHVPIYPRYTKMIQLMSLDGFKQTDLLASDELHPNDFMYDCTATGLADMIRKGAK